MGLSGRHLKIVMRLTWVTLRPGAEARYPVHMYAIADRPESETATSAFSGSTDGRSLRRERNRDSVIEALLALVREGNMDPGGAEIAERAGVSHRSVFRYFDDLGDLIRTAIDTELSRGSHARRHRRPRRRHVPAPPRRTRRHEDPDVRVHPRDHLPRPRARVRHSGDRRAVHRGSPPPPASRLVKQLEPELQRVPAAERDSVIDAAQCLVSWDSYDWHKRILGHDDDEIRRAWRHRPDRHCSIGELSPDPAVRLPAARAVACRRLCGCSSTARTTVFQTVNRGSIPLTRSNRPALGSPDVPPQRRPTRHDRGRHT